MLNKIEKIQESMKQRLATILSKESVAKKSNSNQFKTSLELSKKQYSEYNALEMQHKPKLSAVTQAVEEDYTNTATRKHFRIDDEKASKSINHQSNIIKPLLEVIEEVNQEDNRFGILDDADDVSIEEE
jgi:multidrug efflux pump subunit AcrB